MKTCTQRLSVPPASCASHREKRLPTFLFAVFVFALWLAAPWVRGAVTLTTLYTFAQTNGSYPHGSDPMGRLAQGADGNFYGVTDSGGTNDYGTAFKVTTNGTLTTLYSFTGGNDGGYPVAGLVQAGDGNFYGSTEQDGSGYGGTLFRITPGGTLTTLVSFNNGGPACTPEAEMVLDAAGNMWGTTEDAPPEGGGTIFVLTTNDQFNIIFTFPTTDESDLISPDGDMPVAALVLGSDGNMYGTAQQGGSASQDSDVMGYGTIYGVTLSGFGLLYSFTGGIDSGSSIHDGSQPEAALVQGGDGNFYGTTADGGTNVDSYGFGCGTVFKVATNGTLITLHAFTGGSDGMHPVTPLVQGPDGNFYGTTSGGGTNQGGTIFQITPAGALTTLFSAGGSSLGGSPNGLIKGKDGNLYGTTGGGTIIRLSGITPTKPGVTITNVTAGMVVSNAAFTVMGTATDSVAVAHVFFSLNQAVWTNASTANNWTNWTAAVTLTPGTNTFSAYALDTVGNASTTNSVSFDFVVTNQLQIRASGLGTISPNYSNAWLVIGRNYSITSTPASGFVFTNWTISTNWIGGANVTGTNLTFMMASNLTLQANFVDTNKPAVSITNLTAGQRVSNAVFTVKGTAGDNWQVSNVVCQLNGGGWNSATNINNWTNWAAGVTLMAGTNTVAAYAMDIAGNLSSTSSVSFDFVATNQLQIRASGLGTVSPNYSNAWLEIGRNYSITSTPASGFKFSNWVVSTNWIAGTTMSTTNLTFMMASNLTLQVNFLDTNKPTVSITNLTAGQRVSNAVFTVMGTAGDNWQVSNVVCQINGGGWNSATNINNWTNWAAGVTLAPGTNVVQACAVDTSGNVSTTNSVSFQYVMSATLQVQVSGQGSVSPNYNNSLLAIGQSYSMTATAGTGFVFTNWTGGTNLPLVVLTNGATLQFVMQNNLMLQANFISTNPAVTVATFSVTPAAVSNTYTGTITLQIGGLTNTETVVVQKFLDLNTNGVIDGGDLLVQQFTLQDGTNFVIGGVTNFNVPGDLNAATGAITATMNFQDGDLIQKIVGRYLYKLSSPAGHFGPVTNVFTVTNFPFPQWITGNVVSNNTSTVVSNAVVILMTAAEGVGVGGAVANNAGNYIIAAPPGAYSLAAFKSNFVVNMGTPPVVTLTSMLPVTTNIMMTNASSSISGKLVDANNQTVGLPGVMVLANGNDGLVAVTFTDTNGNFTARVTAGGWNIKVDDTVLIVHGYLGLQNGTNVNAGATGVTLTVHKATALIYGSVKDNLGNPFVALDVCAYDNNNLYQTEVYTDANGNYVVGVLGLGTSDSWWVEANGDDLLTNYVFSQQNGNANINAGQAVLQNFTAVLATNYISGTVKDNFGNPIAGVGVSASANINGAGYQNYADTDGNG
ncbi:MAG: beta strand repeat-containing protein [Limisphaerales bacterium]